MAETLGSLSDKLTIVKLKQYHTNDRKRLKNLSLQENDIKNEIDQFIYYAFTGVIEIAKLTFKANKVYKKQGNEINEIKGTIGQIFSKLSEVNCELWHEQEKVYEFENIPVREKDEVVKKLALLNLERNNCIDEINNVLKKAVVKYRSKK